MDVPVSARTNAWVDGMNGDRLDKEISSRTPARASFANSLSARTYLAAWPTAQGRFRDRSRVQSVARQLDVAFRTILLCDRLRQEHQSQPIWLRMGVGDTILVIHRDDIAALLYNAPEPFTADSHIQHTGMSQYQPGALAVSRGEQWQEIRSVVETVLDKAAGDPHHTATAREYASELVLGDHDRIDFPTWLTMHRRIAREVILGHRAAEDEAITDLLERMTSGANRITGRLNPSMPAFNTMIENYLTEPEPGTVAAQLVDRATPHVPAAPQLAHLLSKLGDTLAVTTYRALQLLSARPAVCTGPIYMTAVLQETARLWPSIPTVTRESTTDTWWGEELVPAGTQFLIVNIFNHRDRRRIDFADDFVPGEWLDNGKAQQELLFNGFGHGPQDCPGEALALACGSAVLSAVTEKNTFQVCDGVLRTDGRISYSPPAPLPVLFAR